MNNIRRNVFIYLAVLILIIAAFAGKSYLVGNEREPSLSVRQAVNIFADEDIQLSKTSDPDAEEINGVKPTTFYINDSKNKLHIYHYGSIAERKTAADDIYREKAGRYWYSTLDGSAKNLLLIIELIDEKEMTVEDLKPIGNVYKTVFEKLNDTKEIIYTGAGDNWESQTTVKYYEYFYHDADGTLRYENYNKESTSLKYLGQDIESVGVISYEMIGATGGGSGTGPTLKPDGTVSLGSSGGNGTTPRGDEELTFTIRWNDQEETFTAKVK